MALNQTQRKYAVERLQSIYNIKAAALKNDFEVNPANKQVAVPRENKPDGLEVLKAIAGITTNVPVVLKTNYLQLIPELYIYNSGFGSNANSLQTLVESSNKPEVETATIHNASIQARYKTEVADKQARLLAELTRTRDAIYLGEEEEAMAAISAFNAFTV